MTNWHTANRRRARPARDPRRFLLWDRGMGKIGFAEPRWGGERYAAFATDMLRQMTTGMGLTYAQMAENYDRTESALIAERYRAWWRYEAEQRARIQAWFAPFVDRVYAAVAHEFIVRRLIGYDPQKLLPGWIDVEILGAGTVTFPNGDVYPSGPVTMRREIR